jgi:hypothetical protein
MNNTASNFGATPAGGVYEGKPHGSKVEQDTPETIHEIFQASNSVEIKFLTEHSCYLTWGPMEFRFRRTIDNGWEWDEIVGECFVHVEMMDKNFYWMGLTLPDGRNAHINIGAKRAPVRMTGYIDWDQTDHV